MKVSVTVGLNKLSSLHIPSWHITAFTVSYFLSEILRIPDNGRNRNLEIFYFFFQETLNHYWIVKFTEKIFKEFCKDLLAMVGQRKKKLFSRASKTPVSSLCEYIFLEKENFSNF